MTLAKVSGYLQIAAGITTATAAFFSMYVPTWGGKIITRRWVKPLFGLAVALYLVAGVLLYLS